MIIQVGKKSVAIVGGLIVVCVAVIVVSLVVCNKQSPASETFQPSSYPMGRYKKGAVVSNGGPCAEIGRRVLEKWENAADALIATMVCEGAACIQNMGLGGGFVLAGWDATARKAYSMDVREAAPAAAHPNMFPTEQASQIGGLSVAVPGELKGYEELYRRKGGKAPWRELFVDTIALCREGVPVNKHLAASLVSYKDQILASPTLRHMLIKEDGNLPAEGDLIKLPKLADTLEKISNSNASILYEGSLAEDLVRDVQAAGGVLTLKDLKDYRPRWEDAWVANLSGGLRAYSAGPPASGPLMGFVLRLLDGRITGDPLIDTQRITEAFKFAYARRSELADPLFANISQVLSDLTSDSYLEWVVNRTSDTKTSTDPRFYGAHFDIINDHGTANIVVVGPNGDAVVATSTINLVFGSMVVSESTGIVLNDEMDDFSVAGRSNYFGVPASEVNYVAPGKRPMSSMCPTVIVDGSNRVRLAIGAAGGTRITTASLLVAVRNLWYNETIKEAVDAPRYHHQLMPMVWSYEQGVTKAMVDKMKSVGHEVKPLGPTWRSAVTAVSAKNGELTTVCDFRRPGSIAGF